MKSKIIILFLFAVLSGVLTAQPVGYTVQQPDCLIFFHFTAAGQTSPTAPNAGLDNRTGGCTTWNISYTNFGFTVLSLAIQSAPNANGVPGTWADGFPGQTIIAGANPATAITAGFAWIMGYNAWVRVTLASVTGTGIVDGAAYGWRIPSASANGLTALPATVTIGAPLGQAAMAASIPVTLANDQTAVPIKSNCTSQAIITLTGAGNTKIITGVSAKDIYICHISFSTTAAEDVKITEGTGTNCATAPADVSGLYKSVMSMALDLFASLKTATAGDDICLNQQNAQVLGGVVTYIVQ